MTHDSLSCFEQHKDQLLEAWLSEIRTNPKFSEQGLSQHQHLAAFSKHFLNQVISSFDNDEFPDFNQVDFKPVLGIWHMLLKQQADHGFSTKDTALLIYALKTSLIQKKESLDDSETLRLRDVTRFIHVLDILGMLTFELYSTENEKLIRRQTEQIEYLSAKESEKLYVGKSAKMANIYKAIGLILENDITVLLQGETGTGKDRIATLIHNHSNRKNKPFVAVNCGAIPKDLIESELFGHEKGAFTGAEDRKLGKFELADGGTLFLDEIGELSLELQVKLLRALQNKEIERVGSTAKLKINARIIAATNQNLKTLVDQKLFRSDLYYRLNVYPLTIPPLRERPEDIFPLAEHFLKRYQSHFSTPETYFTQDALHYLENKYWEGNVRELENTIQRAVIMAQGAPITSSILDANPGESFPTLAEPESIKLLDAPHPTFTDEILPLEDIEKQAIQHALNKLDGNIFSAAKQLGISRTTLYNKLQKYGITGPT